MVTPRESIPIDLDKLYRIALENAASAQNLRPRFLYTALQKKLKQTSSKKPAYLISGIRGIGKTTLLLQLFHQENNAFYFSADSLLVKSSTLYAIVEKAYRNGHKTIFIDEIHTYPSWTDELKNIYDDFNLTIIASGSSVASIRKGAIMLGRRAQDIPLFPLTFGEFYYLRENHTYTAEFDTLFEKKDVIRWLAQHPHIEKHYKEYLEIGGFPYSTEKNTIFSLIKRMIYEDAVAEFSLSKNKIDIIDRFLSFLALAPPGEFSYTSFSNITGYGKSTIYEAIHLLKELGIIRIIGQSSSNAQAKATIKILFAHPNFRHAFAQENLQDATIGALREEYFTFHIEQLGFPLSIPKGLKKNPDYELKIKNRKMIIEVGGPSKNTAQLEQNAGAIFNDDHLIVLGFVRPTAFIE